MMFQVITRVSYLVSIEVCGWMAFQESSGIRWTRMRLTTVLCVSYKSERLIDDSFSR